VAVALPAVEVVAATAVAAVAAATHIEPNRNSGSR
jgi:hypothetical protein